MISLAKKNMDDTTLHSLISRLPPRSCALIEDIDAAFFDGVTRETGMDPESDFQNGQMGGVTLSGLLGAIDGVAAQEGRLLFATTNKYSALDSALIRPGRLDVHIKFAIIGLYRNAHQSLSHRNILKLKDTTTNGDYSIIYTISV